jgi:hypothetical protein
MEFNKKFWFYSTILITVMLLTTMASAEQTKSEWLNDNPCMIKIIITNTEVNGISTTTKE